MFEKIKKISLNFEDVFLGILMYQDNSTKCHSTEWLHEWTTTCIIAIKEYYTRRYVHIFFLGPISSLMTCYRWQIYHKNIVNHLLKRSILRHIMFAPEKWLMSQTTWAWYLVTYLDASDWDDGAHGDYLLVYRLGYEYYLR